MLCVVRTVCSLAITNISLNHTFKLILRNCIIIILSKVKVIYFNALLSAMLLVSASLQSHRTTHNNGGVWLHAERYFRTPAPA